MYAKCFKRVIDFLLSLMAICVLSPILLILIIVTAIAMKGNPFFTQLRPGRIDKKTEKEKIFRMIKFRTMTNEKDENGNFLPDEMRLNKFGKILRSTSLDELPELFNILKGDMAIIGPRPQLVRDMVFMTPEERTRHSVRPGLSGLAQCNGRNNMTWEKKFEYDLHYIEHISFWGDIKIIFKTVAKVFARDGINEEGMATAMDLGDYLLQKGSLTKEEYDKGQIEAKELMGV